MTGDGGDTQCCKVSAAAKTNCCLLGAPASAFKFKELRAQEYLSVDFARCRGLQVATKASLGKPHPPGTVTGPCPVV